ncbi:MAG TPA: coenzyme F420-0:L-glutamate ligase [Terriglobales bacterium]|nr:coenzyme F420-0:L-glutamate ligase [Terriglobales bacterium]
MAGPAQARELHLLPIALSGEVQPGDSLSAKLLQALAKNRQALLPGDILVVKHKVVSKAEGQLVKLESIQPSRASRARARRYGLDARVVELALAQSKRTLRRKRNVLITETRQGFICANSGVDVSNVDGGRHAVLLPADPDRSALKLHRELKKKLNVSVPVIITDSFGRPWREGLTEAAIGVAGMRPLHDYRGRRDRHGYPLHATVEAVADELACAAGLVCGKLAGVPACIVRGFLYRPGRGRGRELLRPAKYDLFR